MRQGFLQLGSISGRTIAPVLADGNADHCGNYLQSRCYGTMQRTAVPKWCELIAPWRTLLHVGRSGCRAEELHVDMHELRCMVDHTLPREAVRSVCPVETILDIGPDIIATSRYKYIVNTFP